MAIQATDTNFGTDVIESDKVTLVDFWAPWCGPCRALAPVIEELTTDYEGKANIMKLNTDENPQTASKYGIRSIPTMLVFKNGEVVDQIIGLASKNQLSEVLNKHI